jgi:hypothetical protein
MRYLIPFTVVAFLLVSLFYNELDFFRDDVGSQKEYSNCLYTTAIIIAFLASLAMLFVMQLGASKSDPQKFFCGPLIGLVVFILTIPVFHFGWGIMPVWHGIVVVASLLWTWLAYRFSEKSLRAARNTFIFFYLSISTSMILVGLPASIVMAMIAGTFIAIPAANLADR